MIIGTEQFKRDFLQEVANGEPAELVRVLVPMEYTQASSQSLNLYLPFPARHTLARFCPPSPTKLLQVTTVW